MKKEERMDDETREQFHDLRGAILDLRAHIDTRFQHIETRFQNIDARFQQEREYTDERTRDMETTLLTEFRKWAMQNDATIKPYPARLASLEERVTMLEERLDDLKRPKQ